MWNANGLPNHALEVKTFLHTHNIDLMLISETHLTAKSFVEVPKYKLYHTNHPDGTAHAGSALFIKENIKHYASNAYCSNEIQATNVIIESSNGLLTVSALYMPPKHNLKSETYSSFFKKLGHKFIAGGDYNTKHSNWGSRITTTKGHELMKTVQELKLNVISTGEPTYWPSDVKRKPDLVDFFVTRGLSSSSLHCHSSYDLSSDHTAILAELHNDSIKVIKPCKLHTKKTNWTYFQELIVNTLDTQIPLKSDHDISVAVETFNKCIQSAAWEATPNLTTNDDYFAIIPTYPHVVTDMIKLKRKARKQWQISRHPSDKKTFNKWVKKLKIMLENIRNQNMENRLINLDVTKATDYSLWKTTKHLMKSTPFQSPLQRNDGTWAKTDAEKAILFAEHLSEVFTPNTDSGSSKIDTVLESLSASHQLSPPIAKFTKKEVCSVINKLNINKAPGYDLITGKIMKELPEVCITYLTQIYNAILQRKFVPAQWKVAEIILILKPGKTPDKVTSYRPISLLPIASKIMEILIIKRLKPVIANSQLIPSHQFGFREAHGTVEQVHRLVEKINNAFEHKQYCSAAFLDISQAFDRVWHEGLLYKILKTLPTNLYLLIKSYLKQRHFYVKHGEDQSGLHEIKAGVPQGSVMGPVLYLMYTFDLPTTKDVLVGTFADDTALIATHEKPEVASAKLQRSLNEVELWLKDWRIKANESKSVHVTFSLRQGSCPAVELNGIQIPHKEDVRYLGIYLDRRLTWRKHIFTKRKALSHQLRKLYWMLTRKSKLSLDNKLLLYKQILKPVWSYGAELWGTAAKSNLEILQRFQSKILRMITDAPWYITNNQLHHDLKVPTVREDISEKIKSYEKRVQRHPNKLASILMDRSKRIFKRLKRKVPQDLF